MPKPRGPHQDYSVLVTMDYDGDGYPQTQVAPMGEGGSNAKAEARHPYGFMGRPADADQDPKTAEVTNGAFVKTNKEGSTLHSEAMDDPRVTALLPALPKGGSQTYGGQPNQAATVSTLQHDGQGNIKAAVPTGGTVALGDDQAVFLCPASAIADLQAAINGWSPVANDGGAALKVALTKWLATVYTTKKAKGS